MEQKDYILREIEKIGVMLRYLLGKMMPAKTIEETNNVTEEINNELFENIGYNISSLLNISKKEFDEIFKYNKGFNLENIELLAEFFYNLSTKMANNKKEILKKSLELFEYVDKKGKTFSFERESQIDKIKNELQLYLNNNKD